MSASEDEFLSWVPTDGDNSTTPFLTLWDLITSEATVQFIKINLYGFLIQVLFLPYIGIATYYFLIYIVPILLKKKRGLKRSWNEGYSKVNVGDIKEKIYALWYWVGKIWFGHEVVGLQNCPINEPLIFLSYHGSVAAHLPATCATITTYRQRRLQCMVDSMYSRLAKSFCDVMDINEWDTDECIQYIRDGNDVIICPGGEVEVLQSDDNYRIKWPKYQEFGDVIVKTKATVIPVFCRNIQESFWIPFYFRPFLRGKYAPENPCFTVLGGGLPVKLTVLFGKPIPFDDQLSADETVEKMKNALQRLVDANQRLPGSRLHGVIDRLRSIKCVTDIDYDATEDETNHPDENNSFSIA